MGDRTQVPLVFRSPFVGQRHAEEKLVTPLVSGLTFVTFQTVSLVAGLTFVAKLTGRDTRSDAKFQFFDSNFDFQIQHFPFHLLVFLRWDVALSGRSKKVSMERKWSHLCTAWTARSRK